MDKSILKDLVVGNLYQWVVTNQVFMLLEFEQAGSWALGESSEDKFTHVECWKIMIDDKIESWWMWKGSYRMLE